MEGATFIDYIKNDDCSWLAVITPHQYIEFSLLMAGAALQKQKKISENTRHNCVNTIHDLCRIPRCPPLLLRLLQSPEYKTLFGVSGTAYTFDEHGMLPIHYAVQNPPVTYKFVPSSLKSHHQKSVMEILLEGNPGGVRVADDNGRLPLHYALDSGCLSERDILVLIRLYPDSLRIEDPRTGLLPFMLVVPADPRRTATCNIFHNSVREKEEQKLSSLQYEKSASIENNTTYTARRHQAEWKIDHVRMSYLLLMLCPDAISIQTSVVINSAAKKNEY
jgi:ankyrin repeat protein